jgi:hypothetical protein
VEKERIEMAEINILAQMGICSEFVSKDGAKKKEVSVVIAPVKVEMTSESKMKVVTGCNLWKSCHNEDCYYSMAARKRKD